MEFVKEQEINLETKLYEYSGTNAKEVQAKHSGKNILTIIRKHNGNIQIMIKEKTLEYKEPEIPEPEIPKPEANYVCRKCGRKFTSKFGATMHESRWCSKK